MSDLKSPIQRSCERSFDLELSSEMWKGHNLKLGARWGSIQHQWWSNIHHLVVHPPRNDVSPTSTIQSKPGDCTTIWTISSCITMPQLHLISGLVTSTPSRKGIKCFIMGFVLTLETPQLLFWIKSRFHMLSLKLTLVFPNSVDSEGIPWPSQPTRMVKPAKVPIMPRWPRLCIGTEHHSEMSTNVTIFSYSMEIAS